MEMVQPYMNYIVALLAVVVLLVVVLFILRSFSGRARGRRGVRLGIVEYCEVDQTRRLVLLRRDNVEHLVMIGGSQDLVVEANIGGGTPALAEPAAQPATPEDAIPLRAPRAPVFGAKRPALRSVNPEDDGQNLA